MSPPACPFLPRLQEEWNHASQLRHFSAVRKLDNHPFPAGAPPVCPAPGLPPRCHVLQCVSVGCEPQTW